MRKTKKKPESNPEPYEDMIRLKKLDPYEALIKCDIDQKQDQKSI